MKGINPIEAHFEKILTGVMGVGVLGVVAWQVVLPGNTLNIGGEEVSIADAYKPAEQAANRLKARLEDPSPPLPEVPGSGIADEFRAQLDRPVTERPRTYAMGEVLRLEAGEVTVAGGVRRLAAFSPPAPAVPTASSFRSTIDPIAASEIEGLSDLLPAQQPFDKLAVSVQTTISGTALAEALSEDPDGDGPLEPVPNAWWRDRLAVVGVELERERLVDGRWSELTTVPASPDQSVFIEQALEMSSSVDVGAVASEANADRPNVLRPLYPATIAGEPWLPPAEQPEADESSLSDDPQAREIRNLRRRLRNIETTITNTEQTLEQRRELQSEIDRKRQEKDAADQRRRQDIDDNSPESSGGGNGRPGAGRPGGGGREGGRGGTPRSGGGRGGQPGGGEGVSQPRDASTLTGRIETQLARLTDERQRIVDRLVEVTGDEDAGDDAEAFDPREYIVDRVDEADEIQVWTHDLTAEPGATYRYRVRYHALNPIFGRQPALAEDQRLLAESQISTSAESDWSDPVETTRDAYFFVTSASPGSAVAGATASVDLYQFHYGFWRRGNATVRPGDPLISFAQLPDGLKSFPLPDADADEEPEELGTTLLIDSEAWLIDIAPFPLAPANDPLSVGAKARYEVVLADGERLVVAMPDGMSEHDALLQARLLDSSELGLDQVPPEPGTGGGIRGLEQERGVRGFEDSRRSPASQLDPTQHRDGPG